MKSLLCLCILVVLMTGCKEKSPEAAPTPASEGSTQPGPASTATPAPAARSVAQTAQQAVQAVEQTAEQAQAAAEQATEKAQALLTQARTMLSEKKVAAAGGLLEQLGTVTLDSDQQQVLSGLKEEFQKMWDGIETGLGELKTLVEEKKYSEATALVTRLTEFELPPTQQKLFDDLKAQLQKLINSQAGEQGAKALDNLLGR